MRAVWLKRVGLAAAAALVAGCAAILGIDDGTPRDGDAGVGDAMTDVSFDSPSDAGTDASKDAAPAMCDTDASFDPPIAFSTLDTTANDAHPRLGANELVVFFQSGRDGGLGANDIYTATRTSIGDTWTGVTAVTPVNTASSDDEPSLTGDSLALYLAHASNLYRATRATPTAAFGAPVALAALGSAGNDFGPFVIEDGSDLYFSSTRNNIDGGVSSLFVSQPLADGGFSAVAAVNGTGLTTADNRFAAVTSDNLVMYFASSRTGGQGSFDIWLTTRASTAVGFAAPRVVAEVSSTKDEYPDWISADRCRLYFTSNRGAGDDNVFVATRTP